MGAYDENTITQLVTEIYQLQIKLCAIEADQVAFPPDGGHDINVELCESLHYSPAVISLMKKLPYPKKREMQLDISLLPQGFPLVYTDDLDIELGRDPQNAPSGGLEPLRLDFLLPQDVALTLMYTRDGVSHILDTQDGKLLPTPALACLSLMFQLGTIRLFRPQGYPPASEGYQYERPDDTFHYRNWPPQDAETYLRDLVNNIKTLKSIPCSLYPYYFDIDEPDVQSEMKEIIESYGWPDQFRRDEWKSRMEEHWQDTM
ncbi:hypothetical protein PFICI_11880 [Pestalotiopsis fici W106-1]|uniref:Uncharacterized protein n=1 Tax=Pestalotiopsis fici (strain W106-1 / CGMCC3.15140) TaxID=1229662 RepID=W3WRK9_PESFW|nr:uncharacterized protein PFICI_11880 [Pestalotiopsis fici W106-1]ETS76493.1 hypothetical protein PFICI_11880 [Pestalotiopsis fici W106-1]